MINIPDTHARALEWLETMQMRPSGELTAEAWEKNGYMAIVDLLDRPGDFVTAALQIPMCARLHCCLMICLAACKEVKDNMPRAAKAVFQDLVGVLRLMDDRARRERIWERNARLAKYRFREDPAAPELEEYQTFAGVAVFQAALIYTTPTIPLKEAHHAVDVCVTYAFRSQRLQHQATVLDALKPIVRKEYKALLDAAAAVKPKVVKMPVKEVGQG